MNNSQRHKCFISYHRADQNAVNDFINAFDNTHRVFIRRAVCEMDQNIINSNDPDYVMRRIRELYLADSTVTIVLIGHETWGRKFVDWEIASTLRNDSVNKRSGLIAISLPSVSGSEVRLPARLADNCYGVKKYAQWWKYPANADDLILMIEDAFQARVNREVLVENRRELLANDLTGESAYRRHNSTIRKAGEVDMEPLTLILGLANTVLGNILSDFITGKSRTARRSEIEREVALILNQKYRERLDVRHVVQEVMREVDILSRRDPDLIVSGDKIELKQPLRRPIAPVDRETVQHELNDRLERLDRIIAERRAELGLKVSSDTTLTDRPSIPDIPDGWEFVGAPKEDTKWARALKNTDNNIRKRRAGEEVD